MCYTRDISLNHDLIFSVSIVKYIIFCMFPNAECLESELDLPDYFFPCKILILDCRPCKRIAALGSGSHSWFPVSCLWRSTGWNGNCVRYFSIHFTHWILEKCVSEHSSSTCSGRQRGTYNHQ